MLCPFVFEPLLQVFDYLKTNIIYEFILFFADEYVTIRYKPRRGDESSKYA